MPEQIMFVMFDKDTGTVHSIGNEYDGVSSYIGVPLSKVSSIIEGKEPKFNYVVQYNPKTKDLEFVNKFEHTDESLGVKDFIFELTEDALIDPDIIVIQDIPNTCWKIQIGKELKKNLRTNGASLNANLLFSVTAKGDPNILYKTLFVEFNRVASDNYYIIPFSMPFETTDEAISVYTARRFDTYQFKRIYE
jgi:hypothetical protein